MAAIVLGGDACRRGHIPPIEANCINYLDTIADLRAASISDSEDLVVFVGGYYAANDGGGGFYLWTGASTAADNGGTVIDSERNVGSGRWIFIDHGEPISINVFGAIADSTGASGSGTDCRAAIQACWDFCAANGKSVTANAEPLFYRVSGALSFPIAPTNFAPLPLPNFIGKGRNLTRFVFDDGNYNGMSWTNTGSADARMTIGDFSVFKGDLLGTGLYLFNMAHAAVVGVFATGWSVGVNGANVQECTFDRMETRGNTEGAFFNFVPGAGASTCNANDFRQCQFSGNNDIGIHIIDGFANNFFGGECESNGGSGTGTNKFGMRIENTGASVQGAAIVNIDGMYIENNLCAGGSGGNNAEVWIVNSGCSGSYTIKISSQRHVNSGANVIRMDAFSGFRQDIYLDGTAFLAHIDRVGHQSSATPYIGLNDPAQSVQFHGNPSYSALNSGDIERPKLDGPYTTKESAASAWVRFDATGASPVILKSHNVASVTKNATGDYTITYARKLDSTNNCYGHSLNILGVMQVFSESDQNVRVKVVNLSLAATDALMSLQVYGGMDIT